MRLAILALVVCMHGSASAQARDPLPARFDRAANLIARGQAAARAGDVLSALGYYRDAVSAAPRRSEGYVALGEAYLGLGEPARALEVLLAGARSTAGGEGLWLALFATYAALHDDARALDALRQLRRQEPASTRGLSQLAEEAERRGLFLEALAARRSLLALRDDAEQRPRIRALELLLGNAELVRSRANCEAGTAVERALARCAP